MGCTGKKMTGMHVCEHVCTRTHARTHTHTHTHVCHPMHTHAHTHTMCIGAYIRSAGKKNQDIKHCTVPS